MLRGAQTVPRTLGLQPDRFLERGRRARPDAYDCGPGRTCVDTLAGAIVSTGQGAVWIT
jgi:hypothetical protein